jgi:LysM repeat protein
MSARRILLACLLVVFVSACGPLIPSRATQTPSAAATVGHLTPTGPPTVTSPPPETQASPTDTPPSSISATPDPALAPGSILGQHVVVKGESLFCLGRGYGVLPSAIAQVNGLAASASLTPGQVLKIPAVQWTTIPSGPVCPPQFPSPFSTVPVATGPAPAATGTPIGTGSGPEAILILAPGGGSSLTSPVHVAGQADPTFEQSLVVQIADAGGSVIATAPTQIQADLGQRGPFSVDVPFSVSADQPGRVSVFSTGARDGGLIHLASVEVTLRAQGLVVIVPGQSHGESLAIFTPASLATLSGGTAHLTGFSDYVFENQLGVVICGEGGAGAPDLICGTKDNVLGSGTAYVNSPDLGQPGPFTADVPYVVTTQVRGRIVVLDVSPRDGGIVHLASQEVTLAP